MWPMCLETNFLLKNTCAHCILEKNNSKLTLRSTTPMATLVQAYRNSAQLHHSAGLRNARLSHFPSAMWGTSLPYIHSCKLSKFCHFLWAKGGKRLRDGMHRITYYVLCHYILPAFLRHKPFNTWFIFFPFKNLSKI